MSPERLKQIAILVDTLDIAQADRLLDQFSEPVQQQIRTAVVNLPAVDDQERQRVIQDFVQRQKHTADPMTDNRQPEMAQGQMAGTYADPRLPKRPATHLPASADPAPAVPEYQKYLERGRSESPEPPQVPVVESPENLVEALSQADMETLAAVVIKESPQVLAVVLSILPADKSAGLLELLPRQQQQQALQRLTQLEEVDEQVLDYLQQQLDRIVRRRVQLKKNQRSGPQALAAILSAAHRMQAQGVIQSIHSQLTPVESSERRLPATRPVAPEPSIETSPATQLLPGRGEVSTNSSSEIATQASSVESVKSGTAGRRSDSASSPSNDSPEQRLASPEANRVDAFPEVPIKFEFSRLAQCDRASLEALLATAKPKLTLLALRGAPPKLLSRVLRLLPAAEAREVEYRIQNLGPTRLQDIQQAQHYLLRLATILESMGQFRCPRKRLLPF